MELYYRKSGKGKPLIIIHGLYGSSDNWYTIGNQLAADYEVFLVDQRNHGHSPHDPVHNYYALRDDLHEFILNHKLYKPSIIGHSMGGRTAMFFAASHPKLVDKLCVVDISPCTYQTDDHLQEISMHENIVSSMRSIDLKSLGSRKEADNRLSATLPSPVIRMFLLKNLKITKNNEFYWSLNLPTLEANLQEVFMGIDRLKPGPVNPMTFPVLFIRGELSGYIRENDIACINRYFSHARVVTIPNAGHWLHAEQSVLFLEAVRNFLAERQ